MIRTLALSLSMVCTALLQACNPFVQHYSGNSFTPGATAQLVDTEPTNATRMGESVFATSEDCTSEEALAAARALGAQYVVFKKVDLGDHQSWEQTTMMTRSGAAGGTMAVNVPVPVTRSWHEYRATFYRHVDAANSEK